MLPVFSVTYVPGCSTVADTRSSITSTRLSRKPSRHGVEIARHEPRQPGILITGSGPSLEKQMVRLTQENLGDVPIPGLAQRPLDRRPGLTGWDIGVQLPEEEQDRASDSLPALGRTEGHEHSDSSGGTNRRPGAAATAM